MKKLIISIMAVTVVFAASAAFAADETKVTVGLKGWSNTWKITDPTTGETGESDNSVFMIGPSVNVKFSNNWFLGGSYLATTQDYEFSDGLLTESRADLDLMAGYMFNPQFGIYFGYKSIKGDAKITDPLLAAFLGYDSFTETLTGPGVGILGNIPLSETVALYGNLSFMALDYEIKYSDGFTATDDVSGASVELGVAVGFSENFSGSIGYKTQSFKGSGTDALETTFSGLTLGVNYTF